MSDLKSVWDADTFTGDLSYLHGRLETGDDIATAIILSLFTDGIAKTDDEIPDGTDDQRGWWANPEMGSRLWLIRRAKQTDDTLKKARIYVKEALQWLIDDGVVSQFENTIEWAGRGRMSIHIIAYKPDGTSITYKHEWAWGDDS